MTKTAAFLVLVLLWVAPFAHAQPNSSNIVDTGADAIGAGANITDNTIDTGIAAAGNLTSTDVGSCLRAIGDAWTCETKPGCTCFSNATAKSNAADQFVTKSTSCPDMTKQICDSIAFAKSCCAPCEATFARLSLCSGQEQFKKYNCKSAEQCVATGLASAGSQTGLWSVTAMVATATIALVFWS